MRRRRHRFRPWPVPLAILQVAAGLWSHTADLTGVLFLLAGPILLGLTMRRRPALAVTGLGALTFIYLSLGYHVGPALPSMLVAVVYAVSHGARLAGWLTLGGLYLGWLALGLTGLRDQGTPWQELRWLGLAVLIGGFAELVDNRRQRVAAFRQLYAEEQRRREEERRRREEQERLRMARELHDVLAHSLSLIAVRASVALELMDTNPEEVRRALLAIKEASKGGLDEVRTVLSGLRDPAPRSPAPSLDRLDDLVSETPSLAVTLNRTGSPGPVPAAVSLAGYRVIQEALTNVIRHSRARNAVVHLHQTPHLLLIGITDPGPAISTSATPAASGPAGSGPAGSAASGPVGSAASGPVGSAASGPVGSGSAGSGPAGSGLAGSGSAGSGLAGSAVSGLAGSGLAGSAVSGLAGSAAEYPAGSAGAGSAAGSGLIGIEERAAALGGVAQAGPDPLGGFTVHVALPLGGR